jgi:hypothetical protein
MAILALTFLAPLAGLAAAALAVPALLALYFLKLRRKPVRVSSTLLWWSAAQDLQVNAPFRWIRPSWLLLLQVGALLLVCAAIARPAIDVPAAGGDRVILVVDRSASMSATDAGPGGRTRLEAAKRDAREVVDRLSGGARVMVVSFAADARIETSFTADRARARAAVEAIEPTDQPGRLNEALRLARSFTAADEGAGEAPPRVVVLSDGGFGRSGELVSLGDATLEFLRAGPEPEAPRDNLGVVALSARRGLDDPTVVRLFARVVSTRDRETATALAVSLDGEPVARVPLRLPPGGEQTVSTDLENPAGGTLVASLPGGDALAADDAAGLVLAPPRPMRIALVWPRPGRTFTENAVFDALDTQELGEIERLTPSAFAALDASRFDLVVFDRVAPEALPRAPSLSFGAGLPIPGLVVAEGPDETLTVDFWSRTHPLLRNVSLDTVVATAPAAIELPGPGSRVEGASVRHETLARTRVGPLIVLLEHGVWRRVIVGAPATRTNLARLESFPKLMANAVDFLTAPGAGSLGRPLTTAEVASVPAPTPGAEALEVRTPTGRTLRAPIGPDGLARLGRLERAGVYRIGTGPDAEGLVVSLLDPTESAIRTASGIDVAGRSVAASGVAAVAPREIWTWCVLAAFALMMVEWLVYAWRMRL